MEKYQDSPSVTKIEQFPATVIFGSGDGFIRFIRRSDESWSVIADYSLRNILRSIPSKASASEFYVTSLACSPNTTDILFTTEQGRKYSVRFSGIVDVSPDLRLESGPWHIEDTITSKINDTIYIILGLETGTLSVVGSVPSEVNDGIVICTKSGDIQIWDCMRKNKLICQIHKGVEATCLAFYPNYLVCGTIDGSVYTWELFSFSHTEKRITMTNCHKGRIQSVAVSESHIVSGGGRGCGALKVWSRKNGSLVHQFNNHLGKYIVKVLFDCDDKDLIHSASNDQIVSHRISSGRAISVHTYSGSTITSLDQKIDDDSPVVSSHIDGKICFWDVDFPKPIQIIDLNELAANVLRRRRIHSMHISTYGRFIACGLDGDLLVYDVSHGYIVVPLSVAHSAPVRTIKWLYGDDALLTTSDDGSLCMWYIFEED